MEARAAPPAAPPRSGARGRAREKENSRQIGDRLGAASSGPPPTRRSTSASVSSSTTPLGADPLGGLEAKLALDERGGAGRAGVVEAGAVLAADVEQVGEAAGGDQGRARAALLQQGVGADGHPVGERLDVGGVGAGPREHLLDRGDHPLGLVLGGARDLGGVQVLAVEQGGVGEGPADVDAEEHRSNLQQGRGPGRSRGRPLHIAW